MAAVSRLMGSVVSGPKPLPMATDGGIELGSCSTSRVQELFGLVHPNRMWRRSPKQEHILESQHVVVLVIETQSAAALYMRPATKSAEATRMRRWPELEREEGGGEQCACAA